MLSEPIGEEKREVSDALRGVLQKPQLYSPLAAPSWEVRVFREVTSTMEVARNALDGLTEDTPLLVLADSQTKGRGRQGRSWFSAEGAFAATYVFTSKGPLSRLSGFSLLVGCELGDLLRSWGAEVGLKWPNDVLSLDRRKICGVLIEIVSRGPVHHALIGIGMNLLRTPNEMPQSSSVFELSGLKFAPAQVAEQLSPLLWSAWRSMCENGFAPQRSRWLAQALLTGEELTFDVGGALVIGRMVGISEAGALQLEHEGVVREVLSGHQISSL